MLHLLAEGEVHFNWWLDGSIVGVYLLATMIAGIMVRKYVGKVEDFLVARRLGPFARGPCWGPGSASTLSHLKDSFS